LRVPDRPVNEEYNHLQQQQLPQQQKESPNKKEELDKKHSLFSNSTTINRPTQTGMLSATAATNNRGGSPNAASGGSGGGKLKSSDLTLSRSLLIVTRWVIYFLLEKRKGNLGELKKLFFAKINYFITTKN